MFQRSDHSKLKDVPITSHRENSDYKLGTQSKDVLRYFFRARILAGSAAQSCSQFRKKRALPD